MIIVFIIIILLILITFIIVLCKIYDNIPKIIILNSDIILSEKNGYHLIYISDNETYHLKGIIIDSYGKEYNNIEIKMGQSVELYHSNKSNKWFIIGTGARIYN